MRGKKTERRVDPRSSRRLIGFRGGTWLVGERITVKVHLHFPTTMCPVFLTHRVRRRQRIRLSKKKENGSRLPVTKQ